MEKESRVFVVVPTSLNLVDTIFYLILAIRLLIMQAVSLVTN